MASSVPQKDDVDRWSVEQVAAWLRQMELTDCCEVFLRKGIDGHSLLHLTEESLVLWGRDLSIRNCKQIMKLISQIQNQHVFGSGRQQINNIIGSRSHVPSRIHANRQSHQAELNRGGGDMENDSDDGLDSDDGWSTDEFDDNREQDFTVSNHPQDIGNTDNSNDAELYMTPSPAITAPNYPSHVSKNFTNKPSPSPGPSSQQKGYSSPLVSALVNRLEKNPPFPSSNQGSGPRGPAPIEPPRRTPPVPPGGRIPAPTPGFGATSKPESNRRGPLPLPGYPQLPGGQVPRSGSPKTVGGPQDYNSRGPAPVPSQAPPLARRGPLPIPGYSQGSEGLKDSARQGPVPRAGSPKTVVGPQDYSSRGPVHLPGLPPTSDSLRRGAVLPPVTGQQNSIQSEQSDSLRRGPAPIPTSPSLQEQGSSDIKRRAPMPLPASPVPRPGSPKTVGGSLDSSRRGSVPLPSQAPTSDPPRRVAVPPPLSAQQNSSQAEQIDSVQRGPPPVPPTQVQQEHGSLDIKKRGPMPLPASPTVLQQGPVTPLHSKTNSSGPETQSIPPIRPPSRPPPRLNPAAGATNSPNNTGNVRSNFPGNANEGGHPPVRKSSSVNKTINLFNAAMQPPSNASEESGHVYEVVEDPTGSFSNQENFSATQPSVPSPTNPPALPPRNQDAREPGGRAGVSGHPLLQQPAPSHGLAPARPQNPSPQPVQLPTLAPPPVPKQFPGVGQPRLPAPPPQVPVNNQQFLDKPPTEMAPAVPGAAAPLQANQVERAERVPLDDGGTIELTPLYRSLYERPYFHIISRIKSKEILETAADGVFLIRPSKRSSEPLTLCLRYKNRTYNINIRCRPDGLFALGYQKTNEMTFRSIDDLVSTYTREPIKLQNGDRTLLTVPPPKFDHIYVKMPTTFNSNRK